MTDSLIWSISFNYQICNEIEIWQIMNTCQKICIPIFGDYCLYTFVVPEKICRLWECFTCLVSVTWKTKVDTSQIRNWSNNTDSSGFVKKNVYLTLCQVKMCTNTENKPTFINHPDLYARSIIYLGGIPTGDYC